METMGSRVVRLREALKLSQREVAKRCHVSQATMSRIELGASVKLRNTTVMALAQALNTNPIYLTTGQGDASPWTKAVIEMMQDLSSLPEDKQVAISVIVNSLIEQHKKNN